MMTPHSPYDDGQGEDYGLGLGLWFTCGDGRGGILDKRVVHALATAALKVDGHGKD